MTTSLNLVVVDPGEILAPLVDVMEEGADMGVADDVAVAVAEAVVPLMVAAMPNTKMEMSMLSRINIIPTRNIILLPRIRRRN